jgi:hypothetical protein
VRKFDAFASKWRRTRRKMEELYSKTMGKKDKRNVYERIMLLEWTYCALRSAAEFQKETEKKEKKHEKKRKFVVQTFRLV